MKRALVLALLVALSGCSMLGSPGDTGTEGPDPSKDELGWEDGYWYDDPVEVDASDGLSEQELNAVVARSMARIERLRGLEFNKSVPVEIISRSEYREDQPFEVNGTEARWNNQVWEGLLLVGEDRNISAVFEQAYGSAVLGYYSPEDDRIVIVSDSEEPTIDRGTLVHELGHALQDQQFGLEGAPGTQDAQLARNGVVEGEANVIERRYQQRCQDNWSCIETTPSFGGGGDIDRGVLTVITYPYVVGPPFVEAIEDRGGWDAVDALYADYPTSTEQVSSPSLYPDDEPTSVTVEDRSSADWKRFEVDPVADTVGQASIQAMLQQNGAGSGGYQGPATEGWEGDSLVPYRNDGQYGYVWELQWETAEDAREFERAYIDALYENGADTTNGVVYTIPDSNPFGDAFHVTQTGTEVRIVNAPTTGALDDVHAG
jgi:hypothetical protein